MGINQKMKKYEIILHLLAFSYETKTRIFYIKNKCGETENS